MIYDLLVSASRTRRPVTLSVTADDEAEAAWLAAGMNGRPFVIRRGPSKWQVSDGFSVVKVQVLTERSAA